MHIYIYDVYVYIYIDNPLSMRTYEFLVHTWCCLSVYLRIINCILDEFFVCICGLVECASYDV